jgi:hypothetical protein
LTIQAEVDPGDVREALDEQAGGHQKRHGQGDLRGDQPIAEPLGRSRSRGLTEGRLEHAGDVEPRRVQGRVHPEEDSGAQRQRRGEEDHPGIDGEIEGPGDLRGQGGSHGHQGPPGHCQRGEAAHGRQEARLDQELAEHLGTARAQGTADGDLLGTAGPARQEQVRDVGAGDDEDDGRDAE